MDIAGYGELLPFRAGAASDLYRAQSQASARWVAVKVFRFSLTDAAENRFLRDCDLAQSVSTHPHVATLYEAGLTGNRQPYLTMELADGGSVADGLALASHGLFTPAEVARIGVAVAGALDATHAAGAVHRFLQPTSILLGSDGEPLVTELGVGLVAERWEAAGYSGNAVPYHASPEVLEGEAPGPASDVYSLASTLYTMLAGAPPHAANGVVSASTLLQRVRQQEPPSLTRMSVPPALEAVLHIGLAAEPRMRPPTAAAFREELQGVLDTLGDSAPAPTREVLPVPPLPPSPTGHDAEALGISSSVALEPVTQPEADDAPGAGSDRWRRGALIVAGVGVTVALALVAFAGLGSNDGGPSDEPPEAAADRDDLPSGRESPPPTPVEDAGTAEEDAEGPNGGVEAPDDVVAPTGLVAHTSDAGAQLEWDETSTESFVVLVLSETQPPRVETTTDGPSLLIPAVDWSRDDGYCFAVARLDMVADTDDGAPFEDGVGADPDQGDLASEIGPAFSSVVCIRGAAEDTVRTD